MVVTTESLERSGGQVVPLPKLDRFGTAVQLRLASIRGEESGQAWVRLNVRNAFEAVRREGAQVFEIEESFGWASALVGLGVPIIQRLHGPHALVRSEVESVAEKQSGDKRVAAELISYNRVQAVSAPSRGLLDALRDRYGLHPNIASVIPNPMPVALGRETWRPERADHAQFLFVGRFDLCKGADLVLRSFASAAQRDANLRLIVAGPDIGIAQVNGRRVHFDDFVRQEISPEVRSRIEFVGSQPPKRIAELRLQSGIAFIASRFETFGYNIAEAMAVGMPILASDTFGARDLIRDRVDGRIVPVGDVENAANVMLEMASNPMKLPPLGRSAYTRAQELLAPGRIAAEVELLYRKVLQRGDRSGSDRV
jgi:glycosyltransferase involved in cell wall biosynthesis